ncbi:unnamed protein product [Phytophthora fragariaefolia]|uniref:Unnamed protein product n=1 Tax=Phytophthora fragariaefolia TaxID=1490495 RepID=A0A9W6XPB4_9STRA|nr:unnamed protein product [Phytophthora fragariaefolia]
MTTKLAAFAVCCAIATFFALTASQPGLVFRYDAATAAGIDGAIHVKYAGEDSPVAAISAVLDFSRVNQSAIQTFDPSCVTPVAEYKWHIHVRWSSRHSSASFGQCLLPATGNHYDPLFACSADSEHIDAPQCRARATKYSCNPKSYAKSPSSCEKGDLSGKFGNFMLNAEQKASGKWIDQHFPLPSETRPSWSIVLHAVCGNHATRVACAVEEKA